MTRKRHLSQDEIDKLQPVECWFCERPSLVSLVLHNGILVSREERQGGPYRLFTCPHCLKENLCEDTRAGRWFSSPKIKLGLLDFLFSRVGGTAEDELSQLVLKAISWLSANEARRRYFFERDGDLRYSGGSILKKWWPWARESAPPRPGGERRRAAPRTQERARSRTRENRPPGPGAAPPREPPRGASSSPPPPPPPPPPPQQPPIRPGIITPHEILGLKDGASKAAIQRRFHFLAVQYHPDKVHHRGKEFQEHAHEKFIRLKKAYEELLRNSPEGRGG